MESTTRRTHLKLIAGSSLSALTSAHAAPAGMTRLAAEFMSEFQVPGFSIAIAKGGKFISRKAFGVANIEAGQRLNVDHRFRVASVSKPITSAAIFLLIKQGKLKLTDRVFGKGALLGVTSPGNRLGKITVHQLLTHTSGGWKNDETDPMFKHLGKNHLELIGWALNNLPQDHDPGKKYAYSNFGYCLLGRIIENISGQSYEDFVKENLLRPCGIETMQVAAKVGRLRNEVSYYMDKKPLKFQMNVRRMDSHGGWVGTPTDLVNFAMRVDGFPKPPDILKKESIATMTERSGVNSGYACGWSVNQAGNWWHNGSLPGLSSLLVRTVDGYCWAAIANTRKKEIGPAMDKLMWKIMEIL